MLYTIDLQGMEFHAFHGCYDLEQRVGNRFEVTLSITTELGGIAAHDAVEEAVNYLTVYEIVRERMAVTQRTIERVATNIIEALHARFPAVRHVRCTVAKLAPPLGGKIARFGDVGRIAPKRRGRSPSRRCRPTCTGHARPKQGAYCEQTGDRPERRPLPTKIGAPFPAAA